MKNSVAYVTPAFPLLYGNGLAMRAAATLRLLRKWYRQVHLVVVPIYNTVIEAPSLEIAQLCDSWRVVKNPHANYPNARAAEWLDLVDESQLPREWRFCNQSWRTAIAQSIKCTGAEMIVVFRFYLYPYIQMCTQDGMPVWLDLDELESSSRNRLSQLYAIAGKTELARELQLEALGYEALESSYLPAFQRIFTASNIEKEAVLGKCPDLPVRALPNTYPDLRPQPQRLPDGIARFLFVGSLGYYPNEDAVRYFCDQVLPLVQRRLSRQVELVVVGAGFESNGAELPAARFVGAVEDTTPYYANCDAVVVPLRSAGGTRIKILEAFSHARPVVSTTIGAEGLECKDGEHLHIADQPEPFAHYCFRLASDPEFGARTAASGHALFKQRYSPERLEEQLTNLFGA